MARLPAASFRYSVAAALAFGLAWTPGPANAAKLSKADKQAVKQALVACKAQAKGKKVKWLARRKYVKNCVTEALKDHPNIDVRQVLRNYPNKKGLPVENWPGH
jgi:hypothetical protein